MSSLNDELLNDFLRYCAIDTQSDPDAVAAPSSEKELVLAKLLAGELTELGVTDVKVSPESVVYARVPASPGCEGLPPVGLIAHMDTSPDAPGANVKPQIIRYEGGDVLLNEQAGIVMSEKTFPELKKYIGQDIIFTDGTTLLGADDKAGIAVIMNAVKWIKTYPADTPHAPLCIAFTPDEEVGRGVEHFDLDAFGAKYAYTVDGGEIGGLEYENFNAASATLKIGGVGVHPGAAKDKMVNAVRLACEFVSMLPAKMVPEKTELREGFIHVHEITGDVVSATVHMLIRDHDLSLFEAKKDLIRSATNRLKRLNPTGKFTLEIHDSYHNMRSRIEEAPAVLDVLRKAYKACGLRPVETPIRGGTDGAMLSEKGLPCPNIFTGGMNYHGIYEYLPVPSLQKARDVVVALLKLSAGMKAL